MSVLIKGMEMPTDCRDCYLAHIAAIPEYSICEQTGESISPFGRGEQCPLCDLAEDERHGMKEITANAYQKSALRTAGEDRDGYLLNGVMGLCGEAGEVIDLVKKHLHQGHKLDRDKIAEELGDVMWYAALTATAIGCSLGEVMEANLIKLEERYPFGFDAERSIHRRGDGHGEGREPHVGEDTGEA